MKQQQENTGTYENPLYEIKNADNLAQIMKAYGHALMLTEYLEIIRLFDGMMETEAGKAYQQGFFNGMDYANSRKGNGNA